MNSEKPLREHLINLLQGHGAHMGYEEALSGFPKDFRNSKLPKFSNTPWKILEHMRIAQWDIYQFCINPEHISPKFPDGYWPEEETPPNENAWENSVNVFFKDLQKMQDLVADSSTDLFAPIPHGTGQTILREALLVADHNAYHLGQLIVMQRYLEK
ncbi:MAG: ABC transporter [Ignavibacteria bacterium RBG_16_35_7]|nr:MAG: ABC transporter [Ignavibacteria bacterium RBG_16_35_7]